MTAVRPGRVVVGMSGGVDSSVAALLLREQGFDVHGLYMHNWDDEDGYCEAAEDFQAARAACELLGIPLHRVSFAAEYRARVFAHFLSEQRAGRTANPDVLCNREIKFGVFLDYAARLGAQHIATGHYARVQLDEAGCAHLLQGRDAAKDQSYFLHAVDQRALGHTLFPLGEWQKSAVRARARSAGLPNFARPDSTGICFIGERPFRAFLARHLPQAPGVMRTPEGVAVGEHGGLAGYTLGQRQGLGLGGRRGSGSAPWFVVDKDVAGNALVVAQGDDHPWLYSTALTAVELSWIAGRPPALPGAFTAKVRYRQEAQRCTAEAAGTEGCHVRFEQPQRAVTPGQYVVLYAGEECLGGGVIAASTRARL